MQPENQADVIWRLKTAAGHLHAIQELVEAGRPCEEVVHQLRAVKASLRAVETRLLTCQIKQSVEIILNGRAEARAVELARLYRLYEFLVQQPDYKSEANE
jgi:DNA-binding FrmR family transcriptional regulator